MFMDIEYETLLTIQGYAKIIFIMITFVVFYSWVYSLYKRDKTGEKDYEGYSKLVLDDSIDSVILEPRNKETKEKEKII